jgi:hypothetical protein
MDRAVIVAGLVMMAAGASPSCGSIGSQHTGPATGESRTFEIPVRGSAVWKEQALRVDFLRVALDSRCPTGAACIWAGNASLNMNATPGGPFTIRFGPAAGTSDPTRSEVDLAGFRYQVLALVPIATVKSGPVDPASYTVTLEVKRLAAGGR